MATEKQKQANKINAQQSSGPQSSQGKQRSSINAESHGLNKSMNTLIQPEVAVLQSLFEDDGLPSAQAIELAEAHSARARVRAARKQAWESIFSSKRMDPEERGLLSQASADFLADIDLELGGKFWRKVLIHQFERPFDDDNDRNQQITMKFLDKQRRLNRYDVKAVSTLSKLYKKAYKI